MSTPVVRPILDAFPLYLCTIVYDTVAILEIRFDLLLPKLLISHQNVKNSQTDPQKKKEASKMPLSLATQDAIAYID